MLFNQHMFNFKTKGSNCRYKWLVDRPLSLEADEIYQHRSHCKNVIWRIVVYLGWSRCRISPVFDDGTSQYPPTYRRSGRWSSRPWNRQRVLSHQATSTRTGPASSADDNWAFHAAPRSHPTRCPIRVTSCRPTRWRTGWAWEDVPPTPKARLLCGPEGEDD